MVKSMCAKFHAKISIFPGNMEGGHNGPPHPWGAPKKPILNRVNKNRNINNNGATHTQYIIEAKCYPSAIPFAISMLSEQSQEQY